MPFSISKFTRILIFLLVLVSQIQLSATHIVGGQMTYRCLGNSNYEISLTVRRDCKLGLPGFDNPASIGIFNSQGNIDITVASGGVLTIAFNPDDTLNEFLSSQCEIIGGQVCVHTTTYKTIVQLPSKPGGYLLAYQRCCRNNTINNIVSPDSTGATIVLEISEEALKVCNSSPEFNGWPEIYICGGNPILYDHSAIDPNGDSLVYELCIPYDGADNASPMPRIPSNPPFPQVIFRPPYNLTDVMGGIPRLSINRQTGLLTGYATPFIGQYLVGVCLKEYRNGKLLSVIKREFQYNVRICAFPPIAEFTADQIICDGDLQASFINSSKNTSTFVWYFNYPSQGQRSFEENPIYTFPSAGHYTVALVARRDTICSDTMMQEIYIYDKTQLEANFDYTFTHCRDSVILEIEDKSFDLLQSIRSWNWRTQLNTTIQNSSQRNPRWTFRENGLLQIQLIITSSSGCQDTIRKSIPIEFLTLSVKDTSICFGDSVALLPIHNTNWLYNWKPNYNLSCTTCPNPKSFTDSTLTYTVTVSNGVCTIFDTIRVEAINCITDSCAAIPKQRCLPNGQIEISVYDFENKLIKPQSRKHELYWSISNVGTPYAISNQNPVVVSRNAKFCIQSKIYTWPKGKPKTIEYADICVRNLCDTADLVCSGPCDDFSFILSSFKDDYDVIHNLDFPPKQQLSVCDNPCNYFIGIFTQDGKLIDGNEYTIQWNNGQTGPWLQQMACYDYTLEVIVRKGDCVWKGRYRESCCDLFKDINQISCKPNSGQITWDSIPGTQYYHLEFKYDANNVSCNKRNPLDSFPEKIKVNTLARWNIPKSFPGFFIRVQAVCRSGLRSNFSPWIEYCPTNKSCNLNIPNLTTQSDDQIINSGSEVAGRSVNNKPKLFQLMDLHGRHIDKSKPIVPGVYIKISIDSNGIKRSEKWVVTEYKYLLK